MVYKNLSVCFFYFCLWALFKWDLGIESSKRKVKHSRELGSRRQLWRQWCLGTPGPFPAAPEKRQFVSGVLVSKTYAQKQGTVVEMRRTHNSMGKSLPSKREEQKKNERKTKKQKLTGNKNLTAKRRRSTLWEELRIYVHWNNILVLTFLFASWIRIRRLTFSYVQERQFFFLPRVVKTDDGK